MVLKPALCLNISGGSAPSGKLSTTLETAFLTSLVTLSKFSPVLKVNLIEDLSSSLVESIVSSPGVPPTNSSIF